MILVAEYMDFATPKLKVFPLHYDFFSINHCQEQPTSKQNSNNKNESCSVLHISPLYTVETGYKPQ